jgi:hypothetical protein
MKITRNNVLKILYKKDTGLYIDIQKELKVVDERKKNQLIELIKSLSEYIDIRLDTDFSSGNKAHNYSMIKINSLGRSYYENTHHNKTILGISRNQVIVAILALVISATGIYFSNIYPLVNQEEKIIPKLVFELSNKTDNDIAVPESVGITLWQGNTAIQIYNGIGKIDLEEQETTFNVPAMTSKRGTINISNNALYDKFIMGDSSLSVSIKPIDGKLEISGGIYFSEEDFEKYYLPIIYE